MPLDQLPDVSQLSQMQFLPAAQYQAAQQNLATQQQSAQLALQQQQNEIQQGSLANLHAQAMNPSTEQEESQKASMGQMSLENAQALQPLTKQEQRQAALTKMSTDQLAQFSAQAQVESADPDPDKQAMGQTKMKALEAFQLQKAKDDAAQQRMNTATGGKADVANINAGAKLGVAGLNTQSQQLIATMKDKTEQAKVQALLQKIRPDQAETMLSMQAQTEEDPAVRAQLEKRALFFHSIMMSEHPSQVPYGINIPEAAGMAPNSVPVPTPPPGYMPRTPAPGASPQQPAPMPAQQANAMDNAPPPIPDMPGMAAYRNNKDMQDLNTAYQQAKDPAQKAAIVQQAQMVQARMQQQGGSQAAPPQAAPSTAIPPQRAAVPPGNVEIFKNGKSVGMVPAAKLQQALKQGYTTQ